MVLSPAWCCLESSSCPWAAEMGGRGSSLPPSHFWALCFVFSPLVDLGFGWSVLDSFPVPQGKLGQDSWAYSSMGGGGN